MSEVACRLPAGYKYADSDRIGPDEIVALMRTVTIGRHILDDHIDARKDYFDYAEIGLIDVGVRHDSGLLVGFGSVYTKGVHGEFADFVVNPEHQGKGIGKAVIDERLRVAEGLGITSLFIHPLEDTNTLEPYYFERGFKKLLVGRIGLGRGPNPAPVF